MNIILIILGLALGSFVNALVWRVHQQSLPRKNRAASTRELSIATGRSMCPHCRHTLNALDLLPVISWIYLRGRCRYCRHPIGWQYPLVELVTAGLFVLSFLFWPYDLTAMSHVTVLILWLLASVGLVALAVYDIRWMLLPNRIVFPVTGIALTMTAVRVLSSTDMISVLFNAIGGLAIAGGIFYVLFQISDGAWIGGGDVKIGFALGLLLGSPVLAFSMLFIASLLGLVYSFPQLAISKLSNSRKIPFGPFLIASTIICMLFGQVIIDWYSGQFLYL